MAGKNFNKKNQKTAIVFGGSGLVGRSLVKQLLDDISYSEVLCFNRKPSEISHLKYKEIITDFSDLKDLFIHQNCDEVYCCLGTTIKKAGSQQNFEKVDFHLPVEIADISAQNKAKHFLVVSSIGANAKSGNFYLRTKGRMEEVVMKSGIKQITIARPSMLLGMRDEFRMGEVIAKGFMKVFSPLIIGKLKKYRPIHADVVAKAMLIIASCTPTQQIIFESNELEEITRAN